MSEKKRKKLAEKCEKIRDDIIDHDLTDEIRLKKRMRKVLNKSEVEELAMQFLLRETLQCMIDDLQPQEKEMTEQDMNMYG